MNRIFAADVDDLVALAKRARWAFGFRLLVGLVPLLAWWLLPAARAGSHEQLLTAAAAYGAVLLAGEALRRVGRRTTLAVIMVMLLVDGAYLAWTFRLLDGTSGPLSHVVVIHAMAITLLTSFRSGIKIAAWDSLLLLCVLVADGVGALGDPLLGSAFPTGEFTVVLAAVWSATFATAAFGAVNERELRRRRYDTEVLRRFSLALENSYDPDRIAELHASLCRDELLARRALLLVQRPAPVGPRGAADSVRTTFALASSTGVTAGELSAQLPEGSVVARALAHHETVLARCGDPVADRWLEELLPGARNLVVVPFQTDGQVLGAAVLEYGGERSRLGRLPGAAMVTGANPGIDRRLVSTAQQATAHAALAVERATLVHRMRLAADTDGLTGLANRRTFDEELLRQTQRSTRTGVPCAVVLVDLDHFKSINDRHGHLVGDEVLVELAATLTAQSRPGDLPARYGGEEFAVVLPETTPQDALAVAERLRAAIEAMTASVPVTASLGVAAAPEHGTAPADLLKAADDALYAAKSAGRNRAVAAATAAVPS